jgi:hypothetical protein
MNPHLTQSQAHTVVNSDQQNAANARLRGGRLVFARISGLLLAALALSVFVTGLPLYFANLQVICNSYSCKYGQLLLQSAQVLQNLGIPIDAYAVFALVLTIAIITVWFIVGGVIFWRKSDDWIALLVSLALILFASTGGFNSGLVWSNPAWMTLAAIYFLLGVFTLILIFFLFPDGRFAPRWMVILLVAFVALLVDAFILPNFIGNSPFIFWNWPFSLNALVLVGLFGSLAFSQLYRYRRMSNPIQRQRTKWVIFAFTVVLVGFIGEELIFEVLPQLFPALHPPDPLYQAINLFFWNICPVLIPLSFGIAILRSRLWDIDIIINRTLVYTALTGTLAVVYIACILILQALLSGFTSGNTVALVGSTLGVAALFQPLRRRIQTRIDRRFYRRKYDAARTIAAFSATLRGKVVLNTLSEQLVAVVQETMQPAHVSLWLQQHDRQGRQQYRALVTAEIAPSRQLIGPLSETDIAETSGEMPRPSPRKISRRAVMIGLAAGGLVVAGGGLSWWLLKRRASFTYTGHTDWVYDVAWSPDGKHIASCSKDKTVQIWDAATGSRIFTYRGHTADVYTAVWSPDGRRIASSSQDKTVQVWDAVDGGHVFTYRGHTDAVVTVAWSPNGTRLASGSGNVLELNKSNDKTVQVWHATDGSHVFTYHGHSDTVEGVVWSPDGRRIASASLDKTVQVWHATDGGHVLTYRGHKDQVFTVAWSPNGKYLASGGANFDQNSPTRDITVQVWHATDGGHIFTYTGHTDWVDGVAWSPDSTRIASASSDKTVQVWDALNGGHVFIYNGHSNYVVTAAWSPDGTRIASASYDDTVQIWSPG